MRPIFGALRGDFSDPAFSLTERGGAGRIGLILARPGFAGATPAPARRFHDPSRRPAMTRYLLPCAAVALCLGLTLHAADPPEAKKASAPTAVGLLRIAQDKDDRTDYRIFRNTQAVLIKARLVLNGALRRPGIADLALVKAQKDPVAWLEENLQVSFPLDGEVLRVALVVGKPSEAAALVNAVVDVYVEQFVARDQTATRDRLDILKKLHSDYDDKLRAKRNALRELAEAVGSRHATLLELKRELALKELNALQMELLGLQSQVRKAQLELSKVRTAELRERLDMLKKLEDMLKEQVEKKEKALTQLGRIDVDLQAISEEIRVLEGVQKKLAAELESLQVKVQAPPGRITVIEKADVPGKD
jgi:uncharacterized protein involved in exopolysaccharide biosynthesis